MSWQTTLLEQHACDTGGGGVGEGGGGGVGEHIHILRWVLDNVMWDEALVRVRERC